MGYAGANPSENITTYGLGCKQIKEISFVNEAQINALNMSIIFIKNNQYSFTMATIIFLSTLSGGLR